MRRTFSIAALMAVLSGAAFAVAPAASAQTGYPPPACSPVTGTISAGSHPIGETFSTTLTPVCVFTPGATVTVTVNGVVVGTKVADASGSVSVTVFVESATSLLIDDPVRVPGRCGPDNRIVATGPSEVARADVTQIATFDVLCPGGPDGPDAGQVPRARQGGVAFTGDNIALMAAAAIVLVGIGAGLVITNRRRRAQPES